MNLLWLFPFLISSFLFFTFPGMVLLEKSKMQLTFREKFFFGTIVGYLVFTLVSYIFLVLRADFLTLPFFLLADLFILRSFHFKSLKQLFERWSLPIVIISLIGIFGQLLVIAPSGWKVNGDLLFWSSHAHDVSWHIALSNEIQKGLPLQNPEFAGEKLKNYHIFSDISPAIFNKYLKIPLLEMYFRLFPLLYSIMLGASAFFLGRKLGKTTSAGIWSIFFVYFAGSFGYIVTLIQKGQIGGEALFWGSQIQSAIGNPPFIAADIFVIAFLFFFLYLKDNDNPIIYIVSILLLGSLAVFKIYASVVLFGALGITGLWEIIRDKKIRIMSLAFLSGILSLVLFLPYYSKTSSFLIFQPWWHVRTIIVEPSRLNLLDWELRRQTYIAEHNWKRVIFLEGLGFLIFFFGNLGMRFLGLWDLWKSAKSSLKNYFNLVFISAILVSLIIPLLFLQKGVAGGTANFLQYFILLFGFLAAITISQFLEKIKIKPLKYFLTFLIVLFAIPTQVGLLHEFYSRAAFAKISGLELAALNYVRQNTPAGGVILTPPYNQYLNLGGKTPNIWDWSDTSYVAAFSDRREYFADQEQVDIMGYDYHTRADLERRVFASTNPDEVKSLIESSGVNYIYYPKAMSPLVNFGKIGLTQILDNQEVSIWRTTDK